MKKILLLLSVILTLGVVTNSCISEKVVEIIDNTEPTPPGPNPPPNPNPSEEKSFNVKVVIDSPLPTPYVNDVIGLFVYNGDNALASNARVPLTNGASRFDLTTNLPNGRIFGYFPYLPARSGIDPINYVGTLSAKQDQDVITLPLIMYVPTSLANQMFMVSSQSPMIDFRGQDVPIQFYHAFSLLRFRIYKDNDFTELTGHRLKKLEVYVSNSTDALTPLSTYNLAGEYSYNLRDIAQSGDFNPTFTSFSNSITVNALSSTVLTHNEGLIVWVVVPPLTFTPGNNLTVRLETEDDNDISYTSVQVFENLDRISSNQYVQLDATMTKDNSVTDDVVIESFVDRPANSYIISEQGLYEIATKKPKGETLNGSSVEWLWASTSGGGTPSVSDINNMLSIISYEEGIIKFRAGTKTGGLKEGNIVLALKDDNNNILWTWHFWFTDKPQDIAYGNGKMFMDRNLGALSAVHISPGVDNYGFVYQWGRKDPFFGGNGVENELSSDVFSIAKKSTVNNAGTWEIDANMWSQTTTGDTNMATRYPMWFICNNDITKPANIPADWLSSSNPNRWSDSEKTDDDPCPHGYKVPSKADLSSLLEFEADNITPKNFKFKDRKYWEYSSGGRSSVWPAAGMRQGRSIVGDYTGAQLIYSGTSSVFGQCFYWTSSQINVGGVSLPGGSHRVYTTNGIPDFTFYKDDYGDNADAYPVRCVKMP